MEKLNEEAGKITDTATKFTDEAGKIVLDRFKNPYISTFLISWLLFNWRPISFFIFSKGTVEYKILLISQEYSNALNYFVYPFLITILYLFALPYLNQANEYFLQKSVKHRANFEKKKVLLKITNDKEIAIADNEKQDEIKKAKEGESHNKFVEELQFTISTLQNSLSDERSKINDLIIEYEEKLKNESEKTQSVVADYETNTTDYLNRISNLSGTIKSYKDDNDYVKKKYNSAKYDLEVEKFIVSRYGSAKSKIISTEGADLLEHFNDLNEIRFFDLNRIEMISKPEAYEILNNQDHTIIESTERVKAAIALMNRSIN